MKDKVAAFDIHIEHMMERLLSVTNLLAIADHRRRKSALKMIGEHCHDDAVVHVVVSTLTSSLCVRARSLHLNFFC